MEPFVIWVMGWPAWLQLFVVPTIGVSTVFIWHKPWNAPENRKSPMWLATEISFSRSYRAKLNQILDRLDNRLSQIEIARGATHGSPTRAWSIGLLDLTLLWAIAYPISMLYLQWLGGDAAQIGGIILEEAKPLSTRLITIFGIFFAAGLLFLYVKLENSNSPLRLPSFIAAVASLFGILWLFTSFDVNFFALAVAVAFAVAVVVAVVVAVALEWFERRTAGPRLWLRLLYPMLLLLAFSAVLILFWAPVDTTRDVAIVLFIAILPFSNGLADFTSIGLTRWCLRRGVMGRPIVWGIADILGGAVIFMALGISVITYVHFVQTPDGPLMDLTGLFNGIRTNPHGYWWVYAMFGSTLLPTLLHFALILLASGYLIVPKIPLIFKGLTSTASLDSSLAHIALSVMIVMCFWVPAMAIWALLSVADYTIAYTILEIFFFFLRGTPRL